MFVNTLEDALQDNETIFRNFENPFTSFQKTLLMVCFFNQFKFLFLLIQIKLFLLTVKWRVQYRPIYT